MESHQTHSHHNLMRQDTVSDFRALNMSKILRADTAMDIQSPSDSCSHNSSLFRTQTQLDVSSTPHSSRSSNIFQQDTLMDTQLCNKTIARRPADIVGYFISLSPRVEDFLVNATETIELGRHINCTIRIASDDLIRYVNSMFPNKVSKNHCTIKAQRIRKRSSFLSVPTAESLQYVVTITDTRFHFHQIA